MVGGIHWLFWLFWQLLRSRAGAWERGEGAGSEVWLAGSGSP